MRVNQGSVCFCEYDKSTGKQINLPTRNDSMEDLIRKAFEQDVIEIEDDDTGETVIKKKNTQKYVIEQHIKQTLLKTGQNRMVESEYSQDNLFEFNPFDDYERLKQERDDFVANFNDENSKLMSAIMYTLSTHENVLYRKSLVAWFMKSGIHVKCRNTFRLKTKFSKDEKRVFEENNEKSIKELIEENMEINEYIEGCIEDFDNIAKPLWDDFYAKIVKFTTKKNQDLLLDNVITVSSNILNNPNTSNLYRDTFEKWTDDKGEKLINSSHAREIRTIIADMRESLKKTMFVPVEQAYYYLGFSRKEKDKYLADAITWIRDNYGDNLGLGENHE